MYLILVTLRKNQIKRSNTDFNTKFNLPLNNKAKAKYVSKSQFANSMHVKEENKKILSGLSHDKSGRQISLKVCDSTLFGLIKGENTVPLISELLHVLERNK